MLTILGYLLVLAVLCYKDGLTVKVLLWIIFAGVIFFKYQIYTVQPSVEKIKDYPFTLNFSDNAEGTFRLGYGTLEGRRNYFYYIKQGEYFKLEKVDAENSLIEESDEKPAIIQYECNREELKTWIFKLESCGFRPTIVRIPKGSIIQEFRVN